VSEQDDIQQELESEFEEDEGLEEAHLVDEPDGNGLRPESIFKVEVPVYEGPMDLLLFVVRQRQVDLIELPVGRVAQDFLEYVRANRGLDLDSAGEVLLVAAILIRMKVRALLPREEEEELEDPEAIAARDEELVEAYREIVAAARELARSEEVQRDYFPRGNAAAIVEIDPTEQLLKNVSLVTLAEAFRDLQTRMEKAPVHQLAMFTLTVDDMSGIILGHMRREEKISFSHVAELLTERIEVVVAFLAILVLIRYRRVRITQDEMFGEIWLMKGKRFETPTDGDMEDIDSDEDRRNREEMVKANQAEMERFEEERRKRDEERQARREAKLAAEAGDDEEEDSEADEGEGVDDGWDPLRDGIEELRKELTDPTEESESDDQEERAESSDPAESEENPEDNL